jgi:hypothetical protein
MIPLTSSCKRSLKGLESRVLRMDRKAEGVGTAVLGVGSHVGRFFEPPFTEFGEAEIMNGELEWIGKRSRQRGGYRFKVCLHISVPCIFPFGPWIIAK